MTRLGPYELLEEIARGGAGVVYRARDDAGRDLAIKLLDGAVADPNRLIRFTREAQALATLRHRNVVPVHDFGEASGRPYLVLDFVPGRSLQQVLERQGPFEPRRAAQIVRELAGALEHAHGKGILHRDVKPDNVLLTDTGTPLLTDFGMVGTLEKTPDRLTQDGVFFGTPGFWPPEQARGELNSIGPRSDVYSLGATLYALLSGQPPLLGEGLLATLDATLHTRPRPPFEQRGDQDPALDAICMRCLEKERSRRYPSAGALASDLERYLRGESIRRSLPRWLVLSASLAVAGALSLAVFLAVGRQAPGVPAEAQGREGVIREAHALRRDHRAKDGLLLLERALAARPGDLDLLGARARLSLAAEHMDDVAADYEHVLSRDPEHFDALVARTAYLALQGGPDPLRADAERLVAMRPDDAEVHTLLAIIDLQAGDVAEALEVFDRSLELDPEQKTARLLRAQARAHLGDLEGALEDLDHAIEGEPSAELHASRGELYDLLGRIEDALVEHGRALRLDPDHAGALWGRARATLQTAAPDLDMALVDLNRAIELAPDLAKAYLDRGTLEGRRHDYESALRDFDQALGLDPGLIEVHRSRGEALLRLGRPLEAIEDLTLALRHLPDDWGALAERSNAFCATDAFERALLDIERALALRDDPNLRNNRGTIFAIRGDYAQALPDFLRAAELAPADPRNWVKLAQTYEGLGRAEDECEAWSQVIRLSPTPVARHFAARGVSRSQRSDYRGALEDFERTLELEPDHVDALINRAGALAWLGELERARQALSPLHALRDAGALRPPGLARLGELERELERLASLGED